jgi:predicted anti-sigma-YlaC factor YlaD
MSHLSPLHLLRLALVVVMLLTLGACSLRGIAVNRLGDALSGTGTSFASDEDPELVGDALPFALKLMESVLAETPRHTRLLETAAMSFTQYSYGWIQQSADEIESSDLAEAVHRRHRARRLFLRARDYGLRGLEVKHPGFAAAIRSHPQVAVHALRREDVSLLYWTAMPWIGSVLLAKDDPEAVADLHVVEIMLQRVLALDETYGDGAIHSFFAGWELGRPGRAADAEERAAKHFARALELSKGRLASPYVMWAEQHAIPAQDRVEFEQMLETALSVDPDRAPANRLENLIAQRRARWLLEAGDELFLSAEDESETDAGPGVPSTDGGHS